jgi:hypothetical protein
MLVLGALVLGACGNDPAASEPDCVTRTLERDIDLPKQLPLTDDLEIVRARVKKNFLVVEAVPTTSVRELYDGLRRAVADHGYETIGTDFEGFEAEIFFARKTASAGALRLREGPCRGQVTAFLLYDPLDTKAGRSILTRTRERIRDAQER